MRVRRAIGGVVCLGATVLVAALAPAGTRRDEPVESWAFGGDWYVLVHFRDRQSEDPEQVFWDDEVWRFALRGGRLVWTLHPHVTLEDRRGRFESLPSGAEARTTGAWSPTPAQRAEIENDLVLDPHSSRMKSLRGAWETGYRSAGPRRPPSASQIEYRESWSIGGTPARPVFARQDTLVSGRTDPALGRTRFVATEVSADGAELRGQFDRDGRLAGDFRMFRIRLDAATAE